MSNPLPADVPAHRPWVAHALLWTVFVIWSHSFLAVRALVGEDVADAARLSPFELVLARFSPVGLFCLVWMLARPGDRREAWALLRHYPVLLPVMAALSVWTYNLAFAAGHHKVPAGTGSLIITVNPVFTFLATALLGLERATWRKAAGMAVAFVGLYFVIVHGSRRAVEGAYLVDAITLAGAPLSWALYTLLGKPVLRGRSPWLVTLTTLSLATIPTVPLALLDGTFRTKVGHWQPSHHTAALFLALGCSLLGYWIWFEALKRVPTTTAATYVFLNPVLALFFEWLWLGHQPGPGLLAGGAIVLAGVWLCVWPGRSAALPSPAR